MAAFGTGNHNFAFSPGHAADGTALGTGKILMLFIRAFLFGLTESSGNRIPASVHKPGIFRPPLLQIAGKHTEDRPGQKRRGENTDHQVGGIVLYEYIDDIQHDGKPKRRHA